MSLLPFGSSRQPDTRSRKKAARNPASGRKVVRPQLEALEDRSLLSGTLLSGFVYHDLNNNGLYEPAAGETPYANSHIELHNSSGATIGSTVTDANGYYQFAADSSIDTTPQTKTYTATFPSTLTNFNLTQDLPQFDPSLGTLLSVDITNTGSITTDIKAENTSDTSPTTITGTVGGNMTLTGPGVSLTTNPDRNTGNFDAGVFDGALDFQGASGLDYGPRTASATRSLQLTGDALSPFVGTGNVTFREQAVATSTASGGGNVVVQLASRAQATVTVTYRYTPSNSLRPGDYVIVQTTEPPGTIEGSASRNGVVLGNPPGPNTIPVHVTGPDMPNNNFGELVPSSLSGHVYADVGPGSQSNDGILEPGEPPIPGATLTLVYYSVVVQTTTTDPNGFYHFDNLPPGNYSILEAQPGGYLDGKDTIGSQGGATLNDRFDITLGQGANGVNNNFGELLPPNSPPPPPPGPPPPTDLQIIKTASAASIPEGGALTYTLAVSNLGPGTATGVTVQDQLPAGVTFVSAGGAGWQASQAGGVVTFTTGSLAAGASATLTVSVLAPGTPGDILNVGTVTSQTPDSNPNNNRSQVTVTVIPPVVSVSTPPPPIPQVFAPAPSSFPGPGDVGVLGKASLFTSSGVSSTDPALLGQISFVEGLYRTVLGREVDNAGLIYWVRQLRAGMSRDAVVQAFWTSDSHRYLQIQQLYASLLNRDPGAEGYAYWLGVFHSGASETTVAAQIMSSPEYLNSHPGAPSFAATLDALNSDAANIPLIQTAIRNFLHRDLRPGEQQLWLSQFHNGLTQQQFCEILLTSDEFYNLALQSIQG
jgi:uncharacterized repeat protein (TIGR01451 family)